MFTFIKKQLYIKKKRKEILKAISKWDIAEETTYDEFRSFIHDMKEICFLIHNTEYVREVIRSIPDDEKENTNDHLTKVLIKYYINLTKQTIKATDLLNSDQLQPQTKEYLKDLMEIIHSSEEVVTDTVETLQNIMKPN